MNPAAPAPATAPSCRFRESCDNCARSKVRCGKEQPWCLRCDRRRLVCSYSPSQRSRKQAMSTGGESAGQNALGTMSKPSTSVRRRCTGSTVSSVPMSRASSAFNALASSNHSRRPTSISTDIFSLFSTEGDGVAVSAATSPTRHDSSSPTWFSQVPPPAQAGSFDLEMQDILSLTGDGATETTLCPRTLGEFDTGWGISTGFNNFFPTSSKTSGKETEDDASQRHCESEIFSTLAALDVHVQMSPHSIDHSVSTQNLGTVLKAARSAVDRAHKVALDCTCAPNVHVALLFTAVVSRVLVWYEMVLQNGEDSNMSSGAKSGNTADSSIQCAVGDGKPPDEASTSPSTRIARVKTDDSTGSSSSCGSLANPTRFIVPSITIGAYELDAENRERIIAHILLSELNKMRDLLDCFAKKFCRHDLAAAATMRAVGGQGQQLHVALEMFMRSKHNAAALAAREKLESSSRQTY